MATLGLLACILLARVWAQSPHAYRDVAMAALLVGVAMTIKVVALAIVVMLAASIVGCLIVRTDLAKRRVPLAASAVLVAPIGFELFRLGSLGWTHYINYWRDQLGKIGAQAGVQPWRNLDSQHLPDPPIRQVGIFQKGLDHLHILAGNTGVPAPLLGVFFLLPFLALLIIALVEWRRLRALARQRLMALSLIIATLAAPYLAWWFLVTPAERAWVRRLLIGWVAINVLYSLLFVMVTRRYTSGGRLGPWRQGAWRVLGVAALAVTAAATVLRLG